MDEGPDSAPPLTPAPPTLPSPSARPAWFLFAAENLMKAARLMKVFVTGPLPAEGRAALAQAKE